MVPEPVLDRHRVLRDAPDAVNVVAMLDKVGERASGVATDVRYGLPL